MSRLVASQRAWLAPAWVREDLSRKAQALPSLDLRFAESKSLTDAASGQSLVTFTRASSGTYVGSDGLLKTATTNEPRFDHNPTTGESLGLLVEEQRTNLLLRSEELATSPWFNSGVASIANNTTDVIDPSGQNKATKLVVAASAGVAGQAATLTATTYTGSVWLRCASGTVSGSLIVYLSASPFTNIGTQSVAITTQWQRFSVVTSAATAATYNFQIHNLNGGTVYAWGAQLEAAAFPTSYIPTTTAAATRSADVASITGTNFSSWYRQDEGTVFADINSAPVNNIAQLTFDISEGAGNERMFQRRNASGIVATAVLDNGVTQGDIGSVVIGASARYRSGYAYKLNDLEIVVNGGGSATDTSATMPTPDRLHIGQNYASGQICNGTLRRLTFWPSRLPSSTLQQITQ